MLIRFVILFKLKLRNPLRVVVVILGVVNILCVVVVKKFCVVDEGILVVFGKRQQTLSLPQMFKDLAKKKK